MNIEEVLARGYSESRFCLRIDAVVHGIILS
jgi:hypothetical protein